MLQLLAKTLASAAAARDKISHASMKHSFMRAMLPNAPALAFMTWDQLRQLASICWQHPQLLAIVSIQLNTIACQHPD